MSIYTFIEVIFYYAICTFTLVKFKTSTFIGVMIYECVYVCSIKITEVICYRCDCTFTLLKMSTATFTRVMLYICVWVMYSLWTLSLCFSGSCLRPPTRQQRWIMGRVFWQTLRSPPETRSQISRGKSKRENTDELKLNHCETDSNTSVSSL